MSRTLSVVALSILMVLVLLAGGCAAPAAEDTTEPDTAAADKAAPEPEPEPTIQELADAAYGTFENVTSEGSGDDIATVPAATNFLVTASHSGSSNFVVEALDSSNQTVDLLVNTIGSYSGTTFGSECTSLKVTADGPWTITCAPISSAGVMVSDPISGTGDAVWLYDGPAATWDLTHDGESNFVVEGADGLLVNEIGAYTGAVPVTDAPGLVIVNADGNWTITPR